MKSEILRMESITKLFEGNKVLNKVNLNVFKGEVLALIGENGAGKSTLIKIIAGVYQKDSGKIFFNEEEIQLKSVYDSLKLGISVIRQEPNFVPDLSIAENIFLGKEICSTSFIIADNEIKKSASIYLDKVGLNLDVEVYARNLSVAERQLVEIARALSNNSSLIIMDEPTASLTQTETMMLKKIIFKLKEEGVSILFISHKLNEVLEVADRISVLRDGNSMGTYKAADCNEEKLILLMTGNEHQENKRKAEHDIGDEILRVENISTRILLKDISFSLRRGEILGFAGLIGSGRTQLMNVIFGVHPKTEGDIYIKGKRVEIRKPIDAMKHKIGLIPDDRNLFGLIMGMSIKDNISLPSSRRVSYFGIIKFRMEMFLSRHFTQRFALSSIDVLKKVKYLSGGNQQKVIISKWLSTNPEILILDEPTKGIDVESKREVRQTIREISSEGKSIILVSSDLQELLDICDRIIIIGDGRIKGELSTKEASVEKILLMAQK